MIRRASSSLLAALLFLSACSRTAPKPEALTPFGEHAEVIAAIESNRLEDAKATLASAPDTPDVHFLRARLAEAALDVDGAYREIKKATDASPRVAEYQYELGVIAGMPKSSEMISAEAARFAEAGRALDAALALEPENPKFLYTKAYWLSVADQESGGDPGRGRHMFDRVVSASPDSAWAHRVLFDRAAENGHWTEAEKEAEMASNRDPMLGSRLWLLVAGTYLRDGKLDETKRALEAAAKLNRATANGFCDAGFALDGGGHPDLGHDFWARCLELLPEGPKSKNAKVRLEAEKGSKLLDKRPIRISP